MSKPDAYVIKQQYSYNPPALTLTTLNSATPQPLPKPKYSLPDSFYMSQSKARQDLERDLQTLHKPHSVIKTAQPRQSRQSSGTGRYPKRRTNQATEEGQTAMYKDQMKRNKEAFANANQQIEDFHQRAHEIRSRLNKVVGESSSYTRMRY